MSDARVIVGDCLEVMPTLDAASVDAIVTDPPYGLGFMGKQWDHGVPGAVFWREALRVAKPGAHLVAFGGTRTYHRLTCAIEDGGWEIRDCLSWLYGSGFPKSHNGSWGGTALKPGWEPIILARKPLVGTVAANVEQYGTGALNIDGCRIEGAKAGGSGTPPLQFAGDNARPFHASAKPRGDTFDRSQGRWPANVTLDEQAAAMLDERSDGASRFFYVPKASSAERNAGLDGFESRRVSGRTDGRVWDIPGSRSTRRPNYHPTVKPVALMRWLVRLVTPPGGLVLDPFCGSGTTGIAAVLEGFRFLGIEREAEYAAIAEARLNATQPGLPLDLGGAA